MSIFVTVAFFTLFYVKIFSLDDFYNYPKQYVTYKSNNYHRLFTFICELLFINWPIREIQCTYYSFIFGVKTQKTASYFGSLLFLFFIVNLCFSSK